MEWKDKIARLFRRKAGLERSIDARSLHVMLKTRSGTDIRSMTDLVRRHRKSDLTIAGIG